MQGKRTADDAKTHTEHAKSIWYLEECTQMHACRRFTRVNAARPISSISTSTSVRDVWETATSIKQVQELAKNTRVMIIDMHQKGPGVTSCRFCRQIFCSHISCRVIHGGYIQASQGVRQSTRRTRHRYQIQQMRKQFMHKLRKGYEVSGNDNRLWLLAD